MEPGGVDNWNIDTEQYDEVKVDTVVHSLINQHVSDNFKFHENSPEKSEDFERKMDGYRNPICDTTTASSKKNASASPPNQRRVNEEIPVCQINTKNFQNKSKANVKAAIPNFRVKKKNKNKNWSAKRKKRNYESIIKTKATKGHYKSGRWTRMEHFKFLEALKLFGKEWQKVQQHVFSRTSTQARSHAQKFFVKLEK